MVAVTYEVRPGLSESESTLYVLAEVELRPTPTRVLWEATSGSGGSVAEERDHPVGGAVTAGAFGPFMCPEATEEIVLRLRPTQVTESSHDLRALSPAATDLLEGVPLVSGTAILDLRHTSARWTQDRDPGHP